MKHPKEVGAALAALALVGLIGYAIFIYRPAPPIVPNTGQVPIDITIEGAGKDVR